MPEKRTLSKSSFGLTRVAMYERYSDGESEAPPYNPTRFQRFMDRWFT